MKSLSSLLLLPLLVFGTACSGDEVEGKVKDLADSAAEAGSGLMDSLKELDVSKLGDLAPEKLTEMASGAVSSIGEQLGSIKDLADVESMKESLMPMLDKLGSLKDALGDKMPSMESLTSAVTGLKEKFAGDASILEALQPVLDKLQGLVG